MSSQDLRETVPPEEPTQNQPGVDFTPVELLRHGHHTDGHGHPGPVQQAGAQEQHQHPFSEERPMRIKKNTPKLKKTNKNGQHSFKLTGLSKYCFKN